MWIKSHFLFNLNGLEDYYFLFYSRIHALLFVWSILHYFSLSNWILVHLYFTDQHAAIKSRMLKLPDGLWNCADCGYTTSYNTTMWKHIEAKHMAQPAPCLYCDKMCPSKNALASHVSRYHRAKKNTHFWKYTISSLQICLSYSPQIYWQL